jgi:hypothetical protein
MPLTKHDSESANRRRAKSKPLLQSVLAGANPLGCMTLFRRGTTLGMLTVISALQSTVDGTWEIDKHCTSLLSVCRGTWARVTIDQFRHLALQTF